MSKEEWLEKFADVLVGIMNDRGISQRDLAYYSGISEGTISKYINKQQMPGLKAIINISRVLRYDLTGLIDFGSYID